jgi:transcriptional regulator with XRE-family HTH domain
MGADAVVAYPLDMSNPATIAEVMGRNLRRIRTALKLTQDAWEEKTGVPQTTLSNWERGVSMTQLERIEEAVRKAGGNPLDLFRVAPTGLTEEQSELLDLWDRCDDKDVRTAILGLLRAKAEAASKKTRAAYGIE